MNIEPNSKNEEIQKFNNDSIKKENTNENNYTMEKTESDKEEQEIAQSIEKDNQPFFIMTLEFEKGKQKKIKIFPNSDPTELSFNFCKDNNLDFVSMKYLTNEIQNLLNKFNENRSKFNSNLIINGSNNSIQEVDEENMLTEKTFEQKMSERSDINSSSVRNNINDNPENKSTRNNFIYSSIDSKGEGNNQEENDINNNNNIYKDDDVHIDKDIEEVDEDKSDYSKHQSEEEEDNEEKINKEKEIERLLNEKIKENISKQNEELRNNNYESGNNSHSNNNDEDDKEDEVKNKEKNNIFIENIYDVDKIEINNSSKGNSIENKKSIENASSNKNNISNNSVNDLQKKELLEKKNKNEKESKKEKTISNKDKLSSKKEQSLSIKNSQSSSKKQSIEHEIEQVNYLSESQKLIESLLPTTTPKNSKSQKNLPKNNISKTEVIQSPSTKISKKNLQQNKNDKSELSQVEDIAALLEIKKKKDLLNLQLEEELKKEQLLTEQKLLEQKLLEEEDQKEREEYLEYEQKQKKSISNNLKQNLILDEVDYNFQLDEMDSSNTSKNDKEKDSLTLNSKNTNSIQNKSNRITTKNNSTINNQEKSNSFSSSSNKPPLTNTNSSNTGLKSFSESQNISKNTNSNILQPTSATTQNILKTSKSQVKSPIAIPVSTTTTSNIPQDNKKNQKLFQYELLTENDAYESYLMQNGGNLFSSQSTQSMGISAMISAANSNRNNNFISQRQKTNPTSNDILSHSNSFNIFEKLYNEAEVNRQLPKRPCHFSSRVNNMSDILIDEEINSPKMNGNNKGYKNCNTTNGNYGEYLYLKGKIQNEIKREKIAKYKYNLNMALRALCKSKPKINKYKRNLSLGIINKNYNIKKEEIDNGKSKEQSKKDSENKVSKEKNKKKIQLLTKRNLENPILKKKLEQIKKEIEKKYTFKPKINSNYHFSPGLNFMQRQEIYNDYLSKKNNIEEEIFTRPYSTTKPSVTKRQSSGNKTQQHPNKLIKQKKNYNTFNKNLNFDLTAPNYIKTNTSQTHISLYKSTNQTKKPFLCTSPNSTSNTEYINLKKKIEIFKKIFSKLDSDEDNLISYISYNKKNLPSNIFKIISPMINQMVKDKGIMSKENFMENMEEIYGDLNLNEKRLLSDYYSKEHNSEKAKSKNKNNDHVKKISQRSRKNSESYVKNYDKKMIQSLSLNNIVKNGKNEKKIIDRNDYFRNRKNNYSNIELKKKNGICITDKSSNNISGIKNYTFTTYKKNLSYELIN